jgi:peptidoglycan/xylan/chitin deacetylase (PgdA/CDA1 family)
MKAYWVKTTWLIKKLFSGYVWDIPTIEKKIYLTFDDGPTPKVTEWVLNQLEKYNASATFFCIGKNIEENSVTFQRIIDQGHGVGNHTYNHLNGWKTKTDSYLENIDWCKNSILKWSTGESATKLFRPPYGKIKRSQSNQLKKKGYKIVMWDVLSADFDPNITKEKCLDNVISNVNPGSIIVFHDSDKAYNKLKYVLPKTLEFLSRNEFKYGKIN